MHITKMALSPNWRGDKNLVFQVCVCTGEVITRISQYSFLVIISFFLVTLYLIMYR